MDVDKKVVGKEFAFPKKHGMELYYCSAADGTNVVAAFEDAIAKAHDYAINYKDRRDELLKLRYEEKRLVELCVELFELQISRGDNAMLEKPGHSELFDEAPLQKLKQKHGDRIIEAYCNMCAYNKHNPDDPALFWKKRLRWWCTHPSLAEAVSGKCPGNHEHQVVESKWTAQSQVYTVELADCILRALVEVI